MDRLWSPWRSEYVTSTHDPSDCFLCEASRAEEETIDNLLVARTEQVVVVLNRYPYNAGHLLVAPRIHEGTLHKLDVSVANEVMRCLQWSLRILDQELHPHAANVGANLGKASGAGVPDHVHMHIVPRWNGDTNFMPVLGDVKVVSESLAKMWQQLHEAFSNSTPE